MIHLKESIVNNPYEFRAELLKDSLQREVFGDGTKRLGPLLQAGVRRPALASAILDQVFGDAFSPAGSILLSRLFGVEDRDVRSRPILLELASRLTSPCS